MAKDYYKILGVNKTDSTEKIKKAYRDAVKRLHPDVSPGGFDKKRFYEIQEAYETLGDEEKRKAYDREQRRGTARRPARGVATPAWMSPPLEDLFAWMEGDDLFKRWQGRVDEHRRHRVEITLTGEEAYRGGEIDLRIPLEETCPFCEGEGRLGLFACPACDGMGRTVTYLPVRVTIPPRIEDGTVMRMPFTGPDGRRHLLVVYVQIDWLA